MSHSLLASDNHHSDADAEDHDSAPGRPQLKAQRPKERSLQQRPSDNEDAAKANAPKVRRKKPTQKPSQARKATSKSAGGGSKRRQANAVSSPTDGFLQYVGAECEWTDALLALGTKELNDVLRKGNYTAAQINDLKSARRRAKNRTYALRSRQKKGGKEQAPCPGPETAQEVFEAAAAAAASAARTRARNLRAKAKRAAERQHRGAAAAAAVAGPSAAAPAGAADVAGPAVTAAAVGDGVGAAGFGGVGVRPPEHADKMLFVESDEDDESLELLQFLAEGQSGTDPASDTGSHTDTSNSGWGSSSYTDSFSESNSYSESNDAFDSEYDSLDSMDLAPDFEMSALTLSDPVAPVVSPMSPVKQQQQQQQQQQPATLQLHQPQPEPPKPVPLNLGQPNELEAMLADLRQNYSAVHSKLDQFAIGLPSIGDGGQSTGGRHSRSTTPTPGDNPPTAIPLSVAADPLFVDLKSGFQSLNAKMDSWLNPPEVGAAAGAGTPTLPSQGTVFDYGAPAMDIEPRERVYSLGGSSSYDHFMAGMMGGSSGGTL